MKPLSVTIQMKAIEQYFPVVVLLYSVAITFELVAETLNCDHSNESYAAVILYTKIQSVDKNSNVCPFIKKRSKKG